MTEPSHAIDATIAATAGVASKATWFWALIAAALSWWASLPSGVAVSLAGVALTLGVNVFFRWLGHRRDNQHKAAEAELRRIEHEAKMRLYTGGEDTAGAPLS